MDPLTLVMLGVLAMLVFFMFRNGRKRKRDQEALQATMVAGADVMTNFGMYGTIVSIDEEENKVALLIAPGTIVNIHRQTIARVVEPVVDKADEESDDDVLAESPVIESLGEPEFGQRVDSDDNDNQPKKGDA
ncbi:preprotein translocase subunit YajC [Cryobacterium psychrophilum]|uniref:Preprotein translocase subunit YajC n=1 Tax=Cryobacterium psychrophilum TaxID=41988 RepID=A0A4Y8KMG6_9MICO|nr:preprotein translocase subunit YajC [Cryobacterium psychrophilum]TDW31438.1 preprotein translocase subunit YajC [Cryobacterium psychrophilum]TFD78877.1 preprotein translocase subunit YajC [Cryobacterium psychrophilum]